jgi:hypothetical protein
MSNTDQTLMQINLLRNLNSNLNLKLAETINQNETAQYIPLNNATQLGSLLFEIERNYNVSIPYLEDYVNFFNYNNYNYLVIIPD